jgi:hypothetical protein
MNQTLKRKFLTIPLIIWVLQLLYVEIALGLFALLALNSDKVHHLLFQITYVLVMISINIFWRFSIRDNKVGTVLTSFTVQYQVLK